jgi:hypothetical protein
MEINLEKIIEEYNYRMKIWSYKIDSGFKLEKLSSSKKKLAILWNKINNCKNKLDK